MTDDRDWSQAVVTDVLFLFLFGRHLGIIDRSMTNYCAGESGKGNRTIPRWRPNKRRKGHLSPRSETNIYHLSPSRFSLFLIGHYVRLIHRKNFPFELFTGMAPTAICNEEEQEGSLLHQTFLLDEEYKVTSVFVAGTFPYPSEGEVKDREG
jgi:hypothetical protein